MELSVIGGLDHSIAMAVLVGVAVFVLGFKLSQLLSPLFSTAYTKLAHKDQVDWDCRLPSTVHAVYITAVSVYLFFFTDLFYDTKDGGGPVIFRTNFISDTALGFSAGYFLADLTYMFQYSFLWQPEMAAHHVAALAAVAAAAFRHHAHNYTLALLATECTTPCVNLRWMLDKAELKDSRLYMLNGLTMTLLWLIGRIVLFFFFFAHAARHLGEVRQLPLTSMLLVAVVPVLLFSLNLFWFAKIVRGAMKLLLGSPAEKARHAEGADASLVTAPASSKDD